MRALQLSAILALEVRHRRQRVMRAAHIAARLRNLLLGNCHDDLHERAAPAFANWRLPQKTAAALYRRGRRLSLAKSFLNRNNLPTTTRLVSERRQTGKWMASLFGDRAAATVAQFRHDIFEFHTWPPGIGFGGKRQLLRDNFADIEQVSSERLRGIGLRAYDRLPALRIPFVQRILLEDKPESVIERL